MDAFLGANDDDLAAAGFAPWLGPDDDADAALHLAPNKSVEDGPDFFNLESMLNLPSPATAFGHASFYAGSSSPESSGGSSTAQHASANSFDFGGAEVSWEGILERPIFPQLDPQQQQPTLAAHSPFASSASASASSASQTFSPPAFVTFGGSPVTTSGLMPPTPTAVPAGGFPPSFSSPSAASSSTSPSVTDSSHSSCDNSMPPQPSLQQEKPEVKRGPAVPPNPELERLLASMRAYNSTYGARLPVLGSPTASVSTYEASVTVMADRPFAAIASSAPVTTTRTESTTTEPSLLKSSAAAAVALHAASESQPIQREQRTSSEDASDGGMIDSDDDEDEHRPMRAVSDSASSGRQNEGGAVRRRRTGATSSSSKAAARRIAGGGLMSSVVVEAEDERGEGEEWRPTPEEYAKLDSKQKRQLRNKISAKNFRNRRKDYVDRLEGHLSERDRLLAFAQEEMQRKERENEELRREMAVLRNAVSMFNQTSFSVNAFGQAAMSAPSTADSTASDSFWSAPAPSFALHPTIQTVSLPPPSKPEPLPSSASQMNLNPLLQSSALRPQPTAMSASASNTFEHFADATPFSVRQATVDQYRSQLWARLAREAAYAGVASTADDKTRAKQLALKPLFFTLPAAEVKTFGPSLATSSTRFGGLPHPPGPSASALIASNAAAERAESDEASAHLALLATVTQQTITTKLTSAFLDAFVAPSPTIGPSPPKAVVLDADKMASVLSGKARLEVVPVEQDASVNKRECPSVTLERALAALSLSFGGACKARQQQKAAAAATASATESAATPTTTDVPTYKTAPVTGWRTRFCPKKTLVSAASIPAGGV